MYGSPLSPLRCSTISRPWRQLALNLCDPRNSVIQAHTPTILPFSRRPIPQSKDSLPVVAAARRTSEENPQEICQGHGTCCPPKCESRRGRPRPLSLPPSGRSKTPNGLEINFGGGFPSSLSSLSFLSSAIVQTPVAIAAQLVSIAILDGGLIDYCINH